MRKLLLLNLLLILCFGKGLAQTITSFLPLSGTTGSAIFIKGSGFTNASAVTIGGTNISVYRVLDDNNIYAILPATSSGSVTVTNAGATNTATLTGFTYSVGVTPTATAPSVGDGTSGNPYQIANLQNLYWLTTNTSAWSKYFIQTANIDAAESSTWIGGEGITPIGNSTTYFTGHYDGQGFSIDHLFINKTSGTYQIGLFGRTSGSAAISNLTLSNPRIVAYTDAQNGGFAGQLSSSTVTNCAVKQGIICGGVQGLIGGFVGNVTTGATVTNCSADINIYSLAQHAGGFVSSMDAATAAVKRSFCVGKVSGAGYQGGFLGWPTSGAVSDCYSRSNVDSIGNLNGGFTGYNSGTVVMTNCYATGTVMGSTFFGGFGGYDSGNTYSHCFWNKTTSTLTNGFGSSGANAGVTGITSTQMQTEATFTAAGWDFSNETANGSNDYWKISPSNNDGYPYLSWQYYAAAPTITSFTPTSGNVGTTVTITGTDFSGVTGITIGGVAVTSYTENSLTSITLTVPVGATSGTIVVTNAIGNGTSTGSFSLSVAPSALSYTTPNVYIKNTAITALSPTVTGTVDSYDISPALPSGLSLNTTTGVISGTPTVASSATDYTVTATNTGGSTTATIRITVLTPTISVTQSLNSFQSTSTTTSIEQSFSVSGTGLSGNVIVSCDNNLYEFSADNTTYNSTLTLSVTNGSLASSIVYVRLKPNSTLGSQNGILTIASSGASSTLVSLTGAVTNLSVNDFGENKLKIYPNPANDFVTISNTTKGAEVSLFDMTGKLLYQTKSTGTSLTINTTSFKNGVYLLKVDGQTTKLLISK